MARRTRKELKKEGEGRRAKPRRVRKPKLPLRKRNYYFLIAGFILAVLGFIFLAIGDTILSPILLTVGYVILIPIGLYLEPKS